MSGRRAKEERKEAAEQRASAVDGARVVSVVALRCSWCGRPALLVEPPMTYIRLCARCLVKSQRSA